MSDLIYTVVQHWPRKKWGLSVLEACAVDSIYQLSNNPKYLWCKKSKDNLALDLWVSRRTIFNLIDKLLELWLIEKEEDGSDIRTTQLYYEEFVEECKNCTDSAKQYKWKSSAKSAPKVVQKVHSDSAEVAPYNNSNKDTNNDIITNVITPDGEWKIASSSDYKLSQFWNKIINETIETVKTACKEFWMIYAPGPNAEERKYAKHLSDPAFAERIQQFNMDLGTFIKNIIKMWSVLQYAKPVNNAKNIYYNRPDIVDKTQKEKLKSDSSTKWVVHLS